MDSDMHWFACQMNRTIEIGMSIVFCCLCFFVKRQFVLFFFRLVFKKKKCAQIFTCRYLLILFFSIDTWPLRCTFIIALVSAIADGVSTRLTQSICTVYYIEGHNCTVRFFRLYYSFLSSSFASSSSIARFFLFVLLWVYFNRFYMDV